MMDKTILTILLFCFVVFSAGAQVGNKQATANSKKNPVEQSKMDKARAIDASQAVQQVANPNAAVITFDKLVHDYGTLTQNDDGNCEFRFTNEGKEPLVLTNVKAS